METDKIISLSGMYKDYFLDYASYVILERAVPAIEDGLKPVQRRILHSMKRMDDGRYQKVANIIGHSMQFHPHGDASIGDALVNLGQKDLLIDTQGNWGDFRTGDSAAAPRYIEARLTKFALEVAFNPQTTDWQLSYDGRNKEPVHLPMKFPLLLAQGVEGIAVGLSTRILPHNFIELAKASIKVLEGKPFKLYPDFQTGGSIDVAEYQSGRKGGKVKIRAKIEKRNKSTLLITELPYSVTTTTLVDSILKAAEKGQIKIKKITDNTAKDVEIEIELAPGISPEVTIDALYAFTNCEVSISPNACVIVDNKPVFTSVHELLRLSTEHTKELLRKELEIKKGELEERWHMASLEKIFIEKRIYRDIEECESWESVLSTIDIGLKKYIVTPAENPGPEDSRLRLKREITEEDITSLTEIRIKKISKYNSFKNTELITGIEKELEQVQYDLDHLTDFAVHYFEMLIQKYGAGKERKTEITSLEEIQAKQVIVNNTRLYVHWEEGFIGMNVKDGEFVAECSDIDDIIAFKKDGTFQVVRIGEKVFVGKGILHAAVWRKGDDRTTYHAMYVDGKTARTMAKRFQVTAITREKDYDITSGEPNSKLLYFSFNPNGESEQVNVQLTPGSKARKKSFDFDFGELSIKGRGAAGNMVTKYPVRKVNFLSRGKSSLGSIQYWMDEVSGRLNTESRGQYLGAFDTGDLILAVYKNGSYEQKNPDKNLKFEVNQLLVIGKWTEKTVVSCVYFEGEKAWSMVKRFRIETSTLDEKFQFLSDHPDTKLYFATLGEDPVVRFAYRADKETHEKEINLAEFIDVKGWKALGNKLGEHKIIRVAETKQEEFEDASEIQEVINPEIQESPSVEDPPTEIAKPGKTKTSEATEKESSEKSKGSEKKDKPKSPPKKGKDPKNDNRPGNKGYNIGDTIEFDF